jgi:hypothetical protein
VIAMKRRMRGKDHRRNVDLAFKKSDLKTLTKPATNTGRRAANMNSVVEKPKH